MEENNEFLKSLEMPNELNLPPASFQFVNLGDYGYLIAIEKFRQLHNLMATARFALSQAHQKLHKSPVLWSSGYIGQIWLRTQYLKNAVLWYNSCDDYFLQIIWFAFDFFNPHTLTKPEVYKNLLKKCRWESLKKPLIPRKSEANIELLLLKINELHSDNDLKEVRNIANSLKHHADIFIQDLDLQPDFSLTSYQGFNSEAVANTGLDIDETVLLLQKAHQKLTDFSKFLINYIDFDKPFENDEKGVIHLDRIKEKSLYKKFYIFP
ncbi:MAG: hypothetical protein EOO90_03530 [Pedobacter sp.]|nr:MAG: hypothetical protein EOO90_03530 [Pedobacter sp.]